MIGITRSSRRRSNVRFRRRANASTPLGTSTTSQAIAFFSMLFKSKRVVASSSQISTCITSRVLGRPSWTTVSGPQRTLKAIGRPVFTRDQSRNRRDRAVLEQVSDHPGAALEASHLQLLTLPKGLRLAQLGPIEFQYSCRCVLKVGGLFVAFSGRRTWRERPPIKLDAQYNAKGRV